MDKYPRSDIADMELTDFSTGNSILDETRSINQGIDDINAQLDQLKDLHAESLNAVNDVVRIRNQADSLADQTMDLYRTLVQRVTVLKSDPEAGRARNAGQVARVENRLKAAIQRYQAMDAGFQRDLRDQIARQYRIVQPEADDAEIHQVLHGAQGGQVFADALRCSMRQGQAKIALSAVQDRYADIQRIEGQMAELARLFDDVSALVKQQQDDVVRTENTSERVVDDLEAANEGLGEALKPARERRRKKWWCFGIGGESPFARAIRSCSPLFPAVGC
jgi:syntaxin 1B/2/3